MMSSRGQQIGIKSYSGKQGSNKKSKPFLYLFFGVGKPSSLQLSREQLTKTNEQTAHGQDLLLCIIVDKKHDCRQKKDADRKKKDQNKLLGKNGARQKLSFRLSG